jgi:hypothetical protein
MTIDTNDWNATPAGAPPRPDPHGQAAILLVESLIHALVARAALSIDDAVDVVSVAVDATIEIAAERGDADDRHDPAAALLVAILASLRIDAAGR